MADLSPRKGYVLTAHAAVVIVERGIALQWIVDTIEAPAAVEADRADPTLRHAIRPIPERDHRQLRVVYNDTGEACRVVTAYFHRRLRSHA